MGELGNFWHWSNFCGSRIFVCVFADDVDDVPTVA